MLLLLYNTLLQVKVIAFKILLNPVAYKMTMSFKQTLEIWTESKVRKLGKL